MNVRMGIRPVILPFILLVVAVVSFQLTLDLPLRAAATAVGAGLPSVLLFARRKRHGREAVMAAILMMGFGALCQFCAGIRTVGLVTALSGLGVIIQRCAYEKRRVRLGVVVTGAVLVMLHVGAMTFALRISTPIAFRLAEYVLGAYLVFQTWIRPYLRISCLHRFIRVESATARRVAWQFEHEDPNRYGIPPGLLRVLETLCLHPFYSSKDIASMVSLSKKTVDCYISRMVAVTGVDNRRQLVRVFTWYYLSQPDTAIVDHDRHTATRLE